MAKLQDVQAIVSAESASEEKPAKAKKSKAVKAEKVPETVTFTIYNADADEKEAALTDLIPLDGTPIVNAAYAMRVINKQHLDHLIASLEAGDTFPPLKVVGTNLGYVVIDGYHRWASYETNLRTILEDASENGEISEIMLNEARQAFFVPIEEIQVSSERDMLNQAFKANLEHGLPASTDSRVRYALWMLEEDHFNHGNMSIREAGRLAHCSHVAILKAAKKIQAATKKMVDVQLTEGEQAEADELAADDAKTKDSFSVADKHMTNLLKAAKFFASEDFTTMEVDRFASSYALNTTKEAVDDLLSLLSLVRKNAPNAPSPEQKELISANPVIPTNENGQ